MVQEFLFRRPVLQPLLCLRAAIIGRPLEPAQGLLDIPVRKEVRLEPRIEKLEPRIGLLGILRKVLGGLVVFPKVAEKLFGLVILLGLP